MIGWFGKLAAMRGARGAMQGGGGRGMDMASYDRPGVRSPGNPHAPAFTPTMPGKQGAFLNFMQQRGIGGYGMKRQQQQRQEAIDRYRFMIGVN